MAIFQKHKPYTRDDIPKLRVPDYTPHFWDQRDGFVVKWGLKVLWEIAHIFPPGEPFTKRDILERVISLEELSPATRAAIVDAVMRWATTSGIIGIERYWGMKPAKFVTTELSYAVGEARRQAELEAKDAKIREAPTNDEFQGGLGLETKED